MSGEVRHSLGASPALRAAGSIAERLLNSSLCSSQEGMNSGGRGPAGIPPECPERPRCPRPPGFDLSDPDTSTRPWRLGTQ